MPIITQNIGPDYRPIGADGLLLVADATNPQGVKWDAPYLGDLRDAFAITSLTVTPSAMDINQPVTGFVLAITYNRTPSGANVLGTSGTQIISSPFTTYTYTGWYNGADDRFSIGFLVTASGAGGTSTAVASATWMDRVYWGASATGVYSSSFITGLANTKLCTEHSVSDTLTAGSGVYLWYAVSDELTTTPLFKHRDSDICGGFSVLGSYDVLNAYGHLFTYYLYKSDYDMLGTVSINILTRADDAD